MSTSPTQAGLVRPRARSRRPILVGVLAILLGILGALLGAVWFVGPRFGIWLVPPTPERYAEAAVAQLEGGYYAQGPAWEQARHAVLERGTYAQSIEDLHPTIADATKVAGGKHSRFETPKQVAEWNAKDSAEFAAPTVETTDGITTITIPELGFVSQEKKQQFADAAAHGIADAAPGTCGWIVDLRGNFGGDMYPMITGVAPLLPDGTGLSFQPRQGSSFPVNIKDGGIALGTMPAQMKTSVTQKVTGQNIAVLHDERTASSAEATAAMFRGVEGVRSFGTPTAGYTSANSVIPMPDGARLVLTQSVYVDRNGVSLGERPMQPDEPTDAARADESAAAWLRNGTCR